MRSKRRSFELAFTREAVELSCSWDMTQKASRRTNPVYCDEKPIRSVTLVSASYRYLLRHQTVSVLNAR